jgi:hypothetical protein
MERRVSVNDEMTSGRPEISPDGLPQGWAAGDWAPEADAADALHERAGKPRGQRQEAQEQGPCLYLGPSGQRCGRRALAGGFCAKHRMDGTDDEETGAASRKNWSRVLAATGAIIALLWPYIEDLVHEIMRWTRTH